MSEEANYIEQQKTKAHCDAMRKYSVFSELQMTNGPTECVLLLGRLNEAISTMLALQDDYYTDYIWNAGTRQTELLKQNGFTEEWFSEVEDKLSLLRTILMGENYDWDEAYYQLYKVALGHEVYWKEFYEERVRTLEHELKKKGRTNDQN